MIITQNTKLKTQNPSRPIRIGIFGGSFDPPHLAHFACVRVAAEKLKLDRVLVIPAAIQPNKPSGTIADSELRCEMINILIENDPLFQLSRIEIDRENISYTIETLRIISKTYQEPEHSLCLLIGADTLPEFDTWREPDKIFALTSVAVMIRPGYDKPTGVNKWTELSIQVEVPLLEISSSMVRERIAAGLPVNLFVGDKVAEVIKLHRLYV